MEAILSLERIVGRDGGRKSLESLLALADVSVGGGRPWDIRVSDHRFYGRVMREGSLGFGESYVDGWWDCDELEQLFHRLLRAGLDRRAALPFRAVISAVKASLFNMQTGSRALHVADKHYNLGNDLFEKMLDKRMIYTCGYWDGASNLDEAQEAKLDMVCRKLGLRQGQRILDIGCGWGGFLKFAAEKYGVSGVGITVSLEQVTLARQLCAGLPIEIDLQDYRLVRGAFDHVVSLGMFEHVGAANYRKFMRLVSSVLKKDGLFLLHTIGARRLDTDPDPWVSEYIFPNSLVPDARQIITAADELFVIEDWHNFGGDYDPTLLAWYSNFSRNWDSLKKNYSDRFYRMWKYYLLSAAGCFRARESQVWQLVLSRDGVPRGYRPVR